MENDYQEIHYLIEKYNKNPNLTQEEIKQIASQLFKIENSIYLNKEISDFNFKENIKVHNLSDLMEEYYRCKKEYAKFKDYEEGKSKTANFLAKILIYLGGLFFIGELYWIYYITFEVYSWDITEPMVYLLGLFNVIVVAILRIKLKGLTPHEFFGKFFLRMISRKYKKSQLNNLEKIRKQIKDIEKFMAK
jgi:hypothetical protein